MQAPRLFASALSAVVLIGSLTCAQAADPVQAVQGSIFQPSSVPSLGKLTVPSGATVTFDTGTQGQDPSISGALTGKGALGVSASGKVQLAVFSFDSIRMAEGANIVVTGDRGLVLVSGGDITVDTSLAVSGTDAVKWERSKNDGSGTGGPGGEGGEYGKSLASAPPPPEGGNGGPAMKDSGRPGHGFGAGFNQRVKGGAGGGGGAYGGAGGATSEGSSGGGFKNPTTLPGGAVYGDEALADLFGGSGGAGASNDRAFSSAGGGGGGGAVSLVSLTSITIGPKGRILAVGGAGGVDSGCGGGGSGGGILLVAPAVVVKEGGQVVASGGAGGSNPKAAEDIKLGKGRRQNISGGGGGGGRIAIYTASGQGKAVTPVPKGCSVTGGAAGAEAKPGADGTYFSGRTPALK